MTIGVEFENINVDNSLLINGHHRYICSLLSKKVLRTNTWGSPSQIPTFKWAEIEIDLNDWETIEMIDRHNSKDAAKSGMDIKNFENLM